MTLPSRVEVQNAMSLGVGFDEEGLVARVRWAVKASRTMSTNGERGERVERLTMP